MVVDAEIFPRETEPSETEFLDFASGSPTDLECVAYMSRYTTVYGALRYFQELLKSPSEKVMFCAMVSRLVHHLPEAKRFAREWLPGYFAEVLQPDLEQYLVFVIGNLCSIFINDEKHFASAIQWDKINWPTGRNWLTVAECLVVMVQSKLNVASRWMESYMTNRLQLNSQGFLLDRIRFLGRPVLLAKTGQTENSVELVPPECITFGGRCLPPFESESCSCKKFESYVVFPSTTMTALEQIASAVLLNRPLLVQGPTGCGKTSIIRYFVHRTRKCSSLVTIQSSDQMDTKACFGSYHFTEIPGEFEWKLGPLALAALEGNWVLVEDVNLAPLDFLQQLASILESGKIYLPGRSSIELHPKFHLFATMRIENGDRWTATSHDKATYLSMFPTIVDLPGFTEEQSVHIASSFHPDVSRLASRYVQLLGTGKAGRSREGSAPPIRKLINYLKRTVSHRCLEDADGLFRNAMDCIVADVRSPEERKRAALSIGSMLNMTEATVDFHCTKYYPKVSLDGSELRIGRATLPVPEDYSQPRKACFAATRSACCLLEQIAVCVQMGEPVLLVGETGCGKTAAVQYLANLTGSRLRVVNMSYQTETADLTGGYSPVRLRVLLADLKRRFEQLFSECFAGEEEAFFKALDENTRNEKWRTVLKMMLRVSSKALEMGIKRESWFALKDVIRKWSQLLREKPAGLAFQYTEGVLMKALQSGEWILLDEVNMASEELLSWLHVVIDSKAGDEVLLDAYKRQASTVSKNFRLFACMNPATDVGKRELPVGLRSLFTEIYVDDISDTNDMQHLVSSYLSKTIFPAGVVQNIVQFYQHVKQLAPTELRSNSPGRPPCFNLRNLCRALLDANENRFLNKGRSLYEAFCLGFLTGVDNKSYEALKSMIQQYMTKTSGRNGEPSFTAKRMGNVLDVCGFPIVMGSLQPVTKPDYVLTKSVTRNLVDLCRVVSARRFPVLLQGETSVGKTSMIQFLAALTGNVCIRINNHQNTDLQDYTGSYVSDSSGKFVFVEGPLVKAMRAGYWIILDELNLAEPDVLEALNRVLDENRELFIPETQEVVTAHENFILFATQNPPGVYSGRKTLSRALKSRFVEINFNELPYDELADILAKSSQLPPSYASKMVAVMRDLQVHRSYAGCLSGRQSYITLRDMFRWGQRFRLTGSRAGETRDWDQFLADQGFFLLGGRSRLAEDQAIVAQVLEKHFRRSISAADLFSIKSAYFPQPVLRAPSGTEDWHIVWTDGLIRMAVLVYQALLFGEAVLMVGETGCAKTTLCQMLTKAMERKLFIINCHMSTEAADFVGRLVPSSPEKANSGALFEWQDGCLVQAMKEGSALLIDEISLAEDSVLERLNSVLEPERTLVLYEKCSAEQCSSDAIAAEKGFAILATMNPGGDYGKRELSRALRNRFTEVWCELSLDAQCSEEATVANLNGIDRASEIGRLIIKYFAWLAGRLRLSSRFTMRDIVTWVQFIKATHSRLGLGSAVLHGGMTLLDGVALHSSCDSVLIRKRLSKEAKQFLLSHLPVDYEVEQPMRQAFSDDTRFGISPFLIPLGPLGSNADPSYCLTGPTCRDNAFRVLRAITLDKPILLEGSPGVGKSSLVIAIAKAAGYPITRINLSEHTDLNDLFGMDMPVVLKNGRQTFAWKDGPLLSAIKKGHWVLLDEMNLASQTVLEGLNSCFDHRGEIFIPELGRLFTVDRGQTRFFASQNPTHQGGSRKTLPKSFLNRFVIIHLDELQRDDVEAILQPFLHCDDFSEELISRVVTFSMTLNERVNGKRMFAQSGGPWEFNVRDLIRLCQLVRDSQLSVVDAVEIIYGYRFRTAEDRLQLSEMACEIFGQRPSRLWNQFSLTNDCLYACDASLKREASLQVAEDLEKAVLLSSLGKYMRAMMHCINMDFLTILVGKSRVGKSMLVRTLAGLCGQRLNVFYLTADTDVTELLGCYEQQSSIDCCIDECLEEARKICDVVTWTWVTFGYLDMAIKVSSYVEKELTGRRKQSLEFCDAAVAQVDHFLDELLSSGISAGVVRHLTICVKRLKEKLLKARNAEKGIRFQWVDSGLVKAIRSGEWILLENVNLCCSAVLERLNSLFEPDGELSVGFSSSENEGQTTYKRNPKFRAFFTMNPDHGEIFRSVRNRGVEICILEEDACFRDPIGNVLLRDELGRSTRQGRPDRGINDQMEISLNEERPEVLFKSPTKFFVSRLNMLARDATFSSLQRCTYLFHCYKADLKQDRDLLNISRRQLFYYSSLEDVTYRAVLLQELDKDFFGGDGLDGLGCFAEDFTTRLTSVFPDNSVSDESQHIAFDPRWFIRRALDETMESRCNSWFRAVQFGRIGPAEVEHLSHMQNMPRCWVVVVKQAALLLDYYNTCKKVITAFGHQPFHSGLWFEAIMYLSALYPCVESFLNLQREQSANVYVEFWMLLRRLDVRFQDFTTKIGINDKFPKADLIVDQTLSCERIFGSLYDSFAMKPEARLPSELRRVKLSRRLLSIFDSLAANKLTGGFDGTDVIMRIKRALLALKKGTPVDYREVDELVGKEWVANLVHSVQPEPSLSAVVSILLKCYAVSEGSFDEDSLDRLIFLEDALLNPSMFTNLPSTSPDANLCEWLTCLTYPIPFDSALSVELSLDELLGYSDRRLQATDHPNRLPYVMRIATLIESPVVTNVLSKVFLDLLRPNGLSVAIGKMREVADDAKEVMKFVWHLGAPLRRMRWHSRRIIRQLIGGALDRVGAAISAAPVSSLQLGCDLEALYEDALKRYSVIEAGSDDIKFEKLCFDVGYLYSWLATTLAKSLDPVLMRFAKQRALSKQVNFLWKELAVCSVNLMCMAGYPVDEHSFPKVVDAERVDSLRGKCAHPYFNSLLDALSISLEQRQDQAAYLGKEAKWSRTDMLNFEQLARHLYDFMSSSSGQLRSLFHECYQADSARLIQPITDRIVQQIWSVGHVRKLISESTGYPDIVGVLMVGLDLMLVALDWAVIRLVRQALLMSCEADDSSARVDGVISQSLESLPFPVRDWRPPLQHAKQLTNADLLRLLNCGTVEANRYDQVVVLLRAQWTKITEYFQRNDALFEMKAESKTPEEAEEAALEKLFSPRQPHIDDLRQGTAETESFYLNQKSLVVEVFRKILDKPACQLMNKEALFTSYWANVKPCGKWLTVFDEFDEHMMSNHFLILNEIYRSLVGLKEDAEETGRLSLAEQCSTAVVPLRSAIARLESEWPNNAILEDVQADIGRLLELPSDTNLQGLLPELQLLLGRVEQWDQVARREDKLNEASEPLRALLIEGRAQELRRWSSLLDEAEIEYRNEGLERALAFADVVDLCQNTAVPLGGFIKNFSVDIASLSVGHFISYVRGIQLLVRHCVSIRRSIYANVLANMCAYYSQYFGIVRKAIATARQPKEKELKDLIRIIKFNTLNWWALLDSVKHKKRQLFNIVKKYKERLAEPLSVVLSGGTVPASTVESVTDFLSAGAGLDEHTLLEASKDCLRMFKVYGKLDELLKQVSLDSSVVKCSEVLAEVADLCRTTTSKLRSPVGYSEKEGNEKLFKRELAQRQKMIAALMRTMSDIVGLSYRKGQLVSFEQIENAAFSVYTDEEGRSDISEMSFENLDTLYRFHWTSMSCWMKISAKNFAGINDQVEKRTGAVMVGLSNLCMNNILLLVGTLNMQRNPLGKLRRLCQEGRMLVDDLRGGINVQEGVACSKLLPEFHLLLNETRKALASLATLWRSAPDDDGDGCDSKWKRLGKFFQSCNPPIASWSKRSSELVSALDSLTKLQADVDSVCKEAELLCQVAAKDMDYLSRLHVQRFNELLSQTVTVLLPRMDELLSIVVRRDDGEPSFHGGSLPEWTAKLRIACSAAQTSLQKARSDLANATDVESSLVDDTFHAVQLFAQSLLKRSRILCEADSPAGTISKASTILLNANIIELNALVRNFNRGLLEAATASSSSLIVCNSLQKLCKTLEACYRHCYRLAVQFCLFYESLGQLVMALCEHGYVEPPPQEEASSGETKFENFENAGLGEGEGIKDVTDEIEDMGQLEDLKKPEEKQEEQGERQLDDVETPIDVEDDFFGNLEDLQLGSEPESEGDDNRSDTSEGGSVESIDDQLGDVDNANEDVLDPELWDTGEEDETTNIDQNNDAPQKPMNELGPKEESNAAADEQSTEEVLPEDLENGEENTEDTEDHMEYANEMSESEGTVDDSELGKDDLLEKGEPEMDEQEADEEGDEKDKNIDAEEKQSPSTSSGYQCVSDATPDMGEPTDQVEQQRDGQTEGTDESSAARNSETDTRQDQLKRRNVPEIAKDSRDEFSRVKRLKVPEDTKTVGDPTKAFKRDVEMDQADLEGADPTETGGNVFVHSADVPEQCDQVIDSATLDVVRGQHMEQLEHRRQMLDVTEQPDVKKEGEITDSTVAEADAERQQESSGMKNEEDEMAVDDEKDDDSLLDASPSVFCTNRDFCELVRHFHSTEGPSTSEFELHATPRVLSAEECLDIWTRFVRFTESLSTELCERLRAILVPTTASRLQGDYRTGKRLNIRKLIPFVASNFRQNKIWLRRTRKARRSYQIVIAIDSSSSMMDNRAKQMAIESLALISNALRRLEVGSIGVCKFGEGTELLSPLRDHFDDATGATVVQGLNFCELRTNVCNLLKCVPSFFSSRSDGEDFSGVAAPARLLVIVSDGRGVYAEGQDAMKRSIQELIQFGVFILFIIIDQENPGKSSIFDVKVPTFKEDGRLEIVSYLEIFPFPFYIILKRIGDLPGVVGDALCQWFQMVADI